MKMRRRALSVLLSLAVVFTFMPFVSSQAYAASSKQPLVTKAVDNNGYTHTYSYNKKGLVKKITSKSSSSTNSSDSKTSATTTVKYNKKLKIASETTKSSSSKTYYRTDKTTVKKRVASKGTVKENNKVVTTYKYNKKGLATKSTTTDTYTKSGSRTDTSRWLDLNDAYKLPDGSYMYRDNGEYKVISAAEAAAYAKNSSSTTTYRDNGNGTYTELTTYSDPEIKSTPVTRKNQTVTTRDYKYNKKKNVKSAKVSTVNTKETSTTDEDGTVRNTRTVKTYAPVTVSYKYKKGRVSTQTTTNPNTYNEVSTSTSTSPDGTVRVVTTTEDAYGNSTYVVTVNGAETYRTTTVGKDKVYPSKDTVTYKYDKNGNVKASKGKETETNDSSVVDEDYYSGDKYGDEIYMITSATDMFDYVKTPVKTTSSWSATLKNTVKNGTKKLTEVLGLHKSSTDGRADGNKGSYSMSRTTYTLKSKSVSSKASKNVEAQQWMIQNGVFSVAGL